MAAGRASRPDGRTEKDKAAAGRGRGGSAGPGGGKALLR